MKKATDWVIIRGVTSDPKVRHKIKANPVMVCVLLDEKKLLETGLIRHHETVFIDDRYHDWDYKDGELRYYSHAIMSATQCQENGDEGADKADILIVYEIEK